MLRTLPPPLLMLMLRCARISVLSVSAFAIVAFIICTTERKSFK